MSLVIYWYYTKSEKQYLGTEWFVSVYIIYTCDCVADWKLWLIANAQHHETVLYHMLLAWVKIIQNSKYK